MFVTLGDIKTIVFYASLFPAFIDISALTLPDIAIILFITVTTVGGVKLDYVFAATKVITMSKELGAGTELLPAGAGRFGNGWKPL
ncbi:MAG TPA: hypothetical protein PKJ85_12695, partial [Nitrosomonas nitrosa]|nr:hypothetical protein [Nitrosomonas nitrosa]